MLERFVLGPIFSTAGVALIVAAACNGSWRWCSLQNRYVGDLGDFGKYGLLKALCGDTLKLGVNWYLIPDESHNGKHTAYLKSTHKDSTAYRSCDPELYDSLRKIVFINKCRNVEAMDRCSS